MRNQNVVWSSSGVKASETNISDISCAIEESFKSIKTASFFVGADRIGPSANRNGYFLQRRSLEDESHEGIRKEKRIRTTWQSIVITEPLTLDWFHAAERLSYPYFPYHHHRCPRL
jgi:hypothetical protein